MRILLGITLGCFLLGTASAQEPALDRYQLMAKSILKELVEIDTSHPTGDNTAAANAVARRLLQAGFPPGDVRVIEAAPGKGNLVARLRSNAPSKRPILLLAHIDVVTANPEDWSVPPFRFTEQEGYWYGRGVTDDKDEAAIHATNLIRWREEAFTPNRDIIVALTADEEGGPHNGVQFLLAKHPDLIDAAFAINEGGGGVLVNGRPVLNAVQAAEKTYQSFTMEVTNPGGHSSIPRQDNAIYQLLDGLAAVREHEFPAKLNEVTRSSFGQGSVFMTDEQRAHLDGLLAEPPDPRALAAFSQNPAYNALLRTTCVATQLRAGHAENALPQRAQATVNCRILPGEDPQAVREVLIAAIGDNAIALTPISEANSSPASPLTEEILAPIYEVTEALWPGVKVSASMSTGATDGLYLRQRGIPVYGTSGLFADLLDNRAHGRDERIEPKSFYDGLEYLNQLVKRYSQ